MDENVNGAIKAGLRRRNVDVVSDQEDERGGLADPEVLSRATELGRVHFTRDDDFLAEAAWRQKSSRHFTGVIYAYRRGVSVGVCIRDLELLAGGLEPEEIADRVFYLPLR